MTEVDGGVNNGGVTYTYDALNRRVRIDSPGNSSLEFIYDPQGRHTSEWDAVNHWEQTGWFYWGNTRLGLYTGGTTEFEHQDWLGTERSRTAVNGTVLGTYTSLPFGDGYNASCCDWDTYHFATLDQDNSANEHAQFREYSNMAGRWFSPDPYSGSYDPTNSQSFNRYAYVMNSPLSFSDPLGLDGEGGITPTAGGCAGAVMSEGAAWGADLACLAGLLNLFGGGPSFHGSLKPRPNAQPWDEYHIHYGPDIAGALGLPDAGCEFGACGGNFGPGGSGAVQTGVGLLNDATFTYVGLLEELGSLRHPYRLFGTRWCGPGGGGATTSNVDAACRAHDLCYGDHGLSFLPNLGIGSFDAAQTQAARGCNQSLYNAVKMYPNEHGSQAIQFWLTNGVGVGILAPGTSVVP